MRCPPAPPVHAIIPRFSVRRKRIERGAAVVRRDPQPAAMEMIADLSATYSAIIFDLRSL